MSNRSRWILRWSLAPWGAGLLASTVLASPSNLPRIDASRQDAILDEEEVQLRKALHRRPFSERLIERWLDHLANTASTESVYASLTASSEFDLSKEWLAARIDAANGRIEQALTRLAAVCRESDDGAPELTRADLLEGEKRWQPAIEALQRARSKGLAQELSLATSLRIVQMHLRMGQLEPAREELQSLRRDHPSTLR